VDIRVGVEVLLVLFHPFIEVILVVDEEVHDECFCAVAHGAAVVASANEGFGWRGLRFVDYFPGCAVTAYGFAVETPGAGWFVALLAWLDVEVGCPGVVADIAVGDGPRAS